MSNSDENNDSNAAFERRYRNAEVFANSLTEDKILHQLLDYKARENRGNTFSKKEEAIIEKLKEKYRQFLINSLNEFLTNGPSDYDVLLLAGNNVGKYTRVSNFCVKISKCYTTTAYLVKNTYYDILIDNFEQGIRGLMGNPKSRSYCLDEFWGQLQLRDKWYLLTPLSVIQKPDKSDIEGVHTDYSNSMLSLDKVFVKNRNFLKFL